MGVAFNSVGQTKYMETKISDKSVSIPICLLGIGKLRYSDEPNDFLWLYHFHIDDEWTDYYVLYKGDINRATGFPLKRKLENIFVRIDSGCMTGMVFGDKTCECKEQLDMSINELRQQNVGFIIHIPHQDGRGMGLDFKLKTLVIQDEQGLNTIRAARKVAKSKQIDRRHYKGAALALNYLGIHDIEVNMATNNPQKIEDFIKNGFKVSSETRIIVPPTILTKRHLKAKKLHLGHLL